MKTEVAFYLCPICFTAARRQLVCHDHTMIPCPVLQPGDERLRPVTDAQGRIQSRAPRWFLDALRAQSSTQVTAYGQ